MNKRDENKTNVVKLPVPPLDDDHGHGGPNGQGDFEETPSYEEIVEMLSEMDDVEYDRFRQERAQRWGVQLKTLDTLRKQAKRVRAYRAKTKTQSPEPDPDDLEAKLRPILETEGILDLWIKSWDKVMAGEHRNAKISFLSPRRGCSTRECMWRSRDRRARASRRSGNRCWSSSRPKM